MRKLMVCCGLLLAALPSARAQSRFSSTEFEQGSVSANVYTNPALGITWEFPKDWVTVGKGVSELGDDYHVILRLVRGGTQSPDLVEFNYSTSTDSTNLNSTLANKGWEPSGNRGYYTLGGGIPAHRIDYKSKTEPPRCLTVLYGPRHGNIEVVVVAESPSQVEELVKAILQMKVQPDWGSEEEPPSSTVPGSPPLRVRVSSGVSQALLKHKVQPTYPVSAREQHIEGSVVMLAHISPQGLIKNLFVMSGQPPLTQAALDAVSQWRYSPYLLQGNAVEVETQITVSFALH